MSPQHDTDIQKVDRFDLGKGARALDNAYKVDGLITDGPGVNLFLIVTGCLPLTSYDPTYQALGLFHACWQGLVKGMVQAAVKRMQSEFSVNPAELVADIGPSVGPCCYKIDLKTEKYRETDKLTASNKVWIHSGNLILSTVVTILMSGSGSLPKTG